MREGFPDEDDVQTELLRARVVDPDEDHVRGAMLHVQSLAELSQMLREWGTVPSSNGARVATTGMVELLEDIYERLLRAKPHDREALVTVFLQFYIRRFTSAGEIRSTVAGLLGALRSRSGG